MNVQDAIKTRKSIRAYLDKAIEREKLTRILEAARLAPSAGNRQEWRFVVVTDREKREELAVRAAGQSFIAEASVVVACCAETDDYMMRCGLASFPIDVAIAIDHITLAAVAEGLGTCWIGAFDESVVREILNIPQSIRVVQLLPIGYPVEPSPVEKTRLDLRQIVHYEKW